MAAKGAAARKPAGPKKPSQRKSAPEKKAAPKKKSAASGGRRKKDSAGTRLIPYATATLLVVIGFFVMAAAGAYILFNPEFIEKKTVALSPSAETSPSAKTKTPKMSKASQTSKAFKTPATAKPIYEVFPAEPEPIHIPAPAPVHAPPHREPGAPGKPLPMVAIIIDDIGHDKKIAEKFFSLNAKLTLSILPHSRFCRDISVLAARKGYEVMLHLPMEPDEYPMVDPGPGALMVAMTPDERIGRLKQNIDAVPYAKGVNNHMGSKLTALSDEMNQVFGILKQRGLFFVDSRTTSASQTRSSARLFKVPYAERDVFLDHVQEREMIRRQIDQLINIAEIHGKAVAIGHPHQATFEVLAEVMPDLKKRVKLVSASEIVEVF